MLKVTENGLNCLMNSTIADTILQFKFFDSIKDVMTVRRSDEQSYRQRRSKLKEVKMLEDICKKNHLRLTNN
jgi:hypothetical protein